MHRRGKRSEKYYCVCSVIAPGGRQNAKNEETHQKVKRLFGKVRSFSVLVYVLNVP